MIECFLCTSEFRRTEFTGQKLKWYNYQFQKAKIFNHDIEIGSKDNNRSNFCSAIFDLKKNLQESWTRSSDFDTSQWINNEDSGNLLLFLFFTRLIRLKETTDYHDRYQSLERKLGFMNHLDSEPKIIHKTANFDHRCYWHQIIRRGRWKNVD